MSRAARNHDKLQFRLGYRFADPDLLDRALTHSSAVSPAKRIERSYQRLEFLGDRVLGLVVADMLYRRYPKANEGELSRTLNTLVRKETCAIIARTLDLGGELNLGESEARTGGAEKEAILGDVTEAVIGAIFCDGGMGKAYEFVERMFEEFLADGQANKADAKTTLQEWAQARGLEPPSYIQVGRSGPDHAPEFTIAIALGDFEQVSATGPSKKIAEHKAAELFLISQQVWKDPK
ncbi:ribonuclease III [Devosia sp. J2-20]|jgi:ribonuclease-3|uniref:ribonuclease III n=1 Tax=Devosia TaxID=46913 RepID=UPI0022AF65EF|nr:MULTISPECIES: ribonuclease III [Devosia]MCZ4346128.1 ribonuclease III [Devosia neptuniae]WDQ98033.1 ribonuclease III [Devosia sp. J2-20]|tara:strand:+ start:2992 stop:3699 length:708 start_codon:yes stop_codon:yes gene_type:complete